MLHLGMQELTNEGGEPAALLVGRALLVSLAAGQFPESWLGTSCTVGKPACVVRLGVKVWRRREMTGVSVSLKEF